MSCSDPSACAIAAALLELSQSNRYQPLIGSVHPHIWRHEDDGRISASSQKNPVDVLANRQRVLQARSVLPAELDRPLALLPEQIGPPSE